MSKRIAIMGAGQMGEDIAKLAFESGYEISGFLDDFKSEFAGYPVIGKFTELDRLASKNINCVIPAFNIPQDERVRIIEFLLKNGFEVPILIHQTVYQGKNNDFGKGTIIFPYVVLGSNIKTGNGCLIKSFSTLGPNVKLGNGVNIYPSGIIGARSIIGNNVLFYMRSGCSDGVKIADGCRIYGNSLLLTNIDDPNTQWAGTPAHKICKEK